MNASPVVAAAIVTHNGARWIDEVLTSVVAQSRPVDRIIVVDDHSSDGTRELITAGFGARVHVELSRMPPATTHGADAFTRIAGNFTQAVRMCADVDFVALADQDDWWHPDRVARQVARISSAAMLASDGRLVDEGGMPIGGTLRSAFPVMRGFATAPAAGRMRWALRHSVATGSACLLRPATFIAHDALEVPSGWLHDRWWSLVACALDAFAIDDEAVIDYRVRADQVVGLGTGLQQRDGIGRWLGHARHLGTAVSKCADLHRGLLPLAVDPTVRAELAWPRLMRTLLAP